MYISIMKNLTYKGFEHYLIAENGKVYNTKSTRGVIMQTPKELKSYPNKNTGYYTVVLRNAIDKPKCVYVHRLVAEHYIANPLNLQEVNHKDFDKSNNSVKNLEWVTTEQNRFHKKMFGSRVKENNSKFRVLLQNGELIKQGIEIWNKSKDLEAICELWDCSNTTVRKILKINSVVVNRTDIPNQVLLKVKNDIINHNGKKFGVDFINGINRKYKLNITQYQFYRLKRNILGKKFTKTQVF
jgi:hypothetical protein